MQSAFWSLILVLFYLWSQRGQCDAFGIFNNLTIICLIQSTTTTTITFFFIFSLLVRFLHLNGLVNSLFYYNFTFDNTYLQFHTIFIAFSFSGYGFFLPSRLRGCYFNNLIVFCLHRSFNNFTLLLEH